LKTRAKNPEESIDLNGFMDVEIDFWLSDSIQMQEPF
jgi:hypothetical protein